jgi:hypothetical protein
MTVLVVNAAQYYVARFKIGHTQWKFPAQGGHLPLHRISIGFIWVKKADAQIDALLGYRMSLDFARVLTKFFDFFGNFPDFS